MADELNRDELLYRQVPHSMEAEQAVLGSMLIDSRCIPQVMEALTQNDFYLKENVEIFQTINKMFTLSMKIDPVTVLEQLRIDGFYNENTSRNYILQLIDITPTVTNLDEYIAIVQDKSLLRRIGDTAAGITDMVQRNEGSAQDILEVAEQRIYDIRQGRASRGLIHISEAVEGVYARLEELAGSDRDIPGLSTGLTDLDRQIAGLNNSDLILLAARPGMGKTSLALNILLSVGKDSGKSVVFFSLEMSREQLAMRLLSAESFIDNRKLVTGSLEEQDWVDIAAAAEVLSGTNILIDDNPSLTVSDMLAKCRRVKNLGLVCVDYLQLMQSAGGKSYAGENRQQAVSDISRAMKIMAKELNVPVLCLSQLSRANESRQDKRPMLSDLRESGAIEQDADIVMFIYRDDYYNPDTPDKNVAELIVAKNRHGETGRVLVQWLPEFTAFSGRDTRHEDPRS
jgi:replicative DNA helicase